MTTANIQLWSIDITPARHRTEELRSLLSDDELQRADNFRFDKDRDRWIAGRAMLRIILSSVIRCSPELVNFEYDEHAKPCLRHSDDEADVYFNLTHSSDLALLAVTSIGPVGIDVEQIKPLSDVDAVVERFFSTAERRTFSTLSADEERLKAFYACWTRKEAYLKALGCGISKPTNTFDVTLLENSEPEIVAIDGDKKAADDWLLFDLQVMPGYVGALAIQSKADVELVWRKLPPFNTSLCANEPGSTEKIA